MAYKIINLNVFVNIIGLFVFATQKPKKIFPEKKLNRLAILIFFLNAQTSGMIVPHLR
jgi:hypothetical protein